MNVLVDVTGINDKIVRLYLNQFMENEKILDRLSEKLRDKNAISRVKQNIKVDEKFQLYNFDLITWFLVTV